MRSRASAVFFDEFYVHDVADAIYLHRALTWWCSHRVRVVATSNYVPDELLPNPLLHAAAEPVIDLIRSRFAVIDLDEGIDHRATAKLDNYVCRVNKACSLLTSIYARPRTSRLTEP